MNKIYLVFLLFAIPIVLSMFKTTVVVEEYAVDRSKAGQCVMDVSEIANKAMIEGANISLVVKSDGHSGGYINGEWVEVPLRCYPEDYWEWILVKEYTPKE